MFRTYLVRVMREFGKNYESRISLSQPNGQIHHVWRGKLKKEEAIILKDYNIVRVQLIKERWFITDVIKLEQSVRRQLIIEHASLIPFKSK